MLPSVKYRGKLSFLFFENKRPSKALQIKHYRKCDIKFLNLFSVILINFIDDKPK